VWPEAGVTYLVGASFLQRFSLFNGRPGVRFEWLDRYRPVDHIGWAIYVFRFSTDPADQKRSDVIYVPREQWYATALERLTPMVARWPDVAPATQPLPAVYADRARWHEEQGRSAEALADYLAAASAAPSSEAYRRLFRDAVQRLTPRLPLDEMPAAYAFRQAAVACSSGERGGCLLALLRTVRRDPQHVQAHSNLGALYAQIGLRHLAAVEWQRCLEIDPDFAPARENLARLNAAAANGDRAAPPQVRP
jgi:tetratricopeptide (TPR) repeat protein